MISSTSYRRLGMLCCKRVQQSHTQLSIGIRGRQLQQVLCQSIHYTTPQLLSDNSDNDDDNKSTTSSTPPVQTLNKSPIVQQLWKTRDEAKRRVMGDLTLGDGEYSDVSLAAAEIISNRNKKYTGYDSKQYEPPAKDGKHPSESAVGIAYLFSQDQFLLETYRNPYGEMRFGKILEDLDALAGNIAFNHVEGNPLIVTAGVDRIRVRRRPDIGVDQYLSGKVTWVGSSSMEIRMKISDQCEDGEEWLEAYFTFVTLHPETKKSIKISPNRD